MKTVALSLLALSGASAFAPVQNSQRGAPLAATAELDGLVGVDVETGKKIVSTFQGTKAEQGSLIGFLTLYFHFVVRSRRYGGVGSS